jgi:hypothetical protein
VSFALEPDTCRATSSSDIAMYVSLKAAIRLISIRSTVCEMRPRFLSWLNTAS